MATERTTWDPRSAMAEEAVEAMAIKDWEPPEARRIIILVCGHWEHRALPVKLEEDGHKMAYCFRCREHIRVLGEVGL